MRINLLGIEDRVPDRFLAGVDPAHAEGMRHHPPLRREQFDNSVFEATRWVVGEADTASLATPGLRAYSPMWYDRIGDGLEYLAIGGHIWGGVPLVVGDRAHDPAGGPRIAAIAPIDTRARRWQDEPAKRPTIGCQIVDLAQTNGW